jgi:Ca-activated chloride channel family protein
MPDFHFLRPWWLLGVAVAALLWWVLSRRADIRERWRDIIAPHLLDHLVIDPRRRHRLRPVHLTVAALALGSIAAAGPAWQRERPPFVEDKAPLAIVIDLSPTMDAIDVTPTRLERVKLKIRDLLALRSGARTAIYVYAGSAHMVLPLTDDPLLVQTYVDSLSTSLMPVPGKDTARALKTAADGLSREDTPGTILFVTDGVESHGADALKAYRGKEAILVLGVGTADGGPVKTGSTTFLSDANGRRVFSRLDLDALRALKRDAGIPVATITTDDGDVKWVQRRVQAHLEQRRSEETAQWKDAGWYLVIPITVIGALWFRRGWTIRWAAVFVIGVLLGTPSRAHAADWHIADMWLTADQQGRLAYEHGDYAKAAERFADPMWKGLALYRAGRYEDAVEAFARVDTPESYYNQGNALAKLGRFPAAVASYREALKRRPNWPEAKMNLAIVQKLIPKEKKKDDEQGQADPNEKPDQMKFDDQGKKGKRGEVDLAKQTAEVWMRTIQTTPADLLARKFAIEAKGTKQ